MANDPKEIKKLLKEIEDAYRKLKESNPFKDWDAEKVAASARQTKVLEDTIKGLNSRIEDMNASINETYEAWKSIINEVKGAKNVLNQNNRLISTSADLSRKLRDHQQGYNSLSEKELKSIKEKLKAKKQDLETQRSLLEQQKQALIDENQSGTISYDQRRKNRKLIADINESIKINNTLLKEGEGLYDQELDKISRIQKEQQEINKLLGVGGGIINGLNSSLNKLGFGNLASRLGMEEANEKMQSASEKIVNDKKREQHLNERISQLNKKQLSEAQLRAGFGGKTLKDLQQEKDTLSASNKAASGLSGQFKVLGEGVKVMGQNLVKSLGPITLISMAIDQLTDALKITDTGAGELAKTMNMTYSEALGVRRELGNMAAMSGDVAVTTKGLQESYVAIGKSLGSNAMASEATLITMTKLREQAGYTNEQLTELNKLSLVNGKSLEQNTKEILGGAKAYASRRGLVINEKEVLNDVVKASASLKLSLGGSADALAKAAVQTRAVGLNLEQAAAMADSLLQFESSIENELSAELLLGKDLNFERARQLALNNDIAGAAEEIANQVGSSANFAEMNAIQQEAIAKAAGLTKDQLAQSLMDREALSKLSAREGENAQQAFNRLVQEVGMAEAKKRLGDEQLANQYEQQSVQERFNQSIQKLQEIFVQLAEPILAIVSPLMNLVSTILPAINILLQPIVGIFKIIGDTITGFTDLITGNLHEGLGGFLQIMQSIAVVWAGIVLSSKMLGKETLKNITLQGVFSGLLKKDFWMSIGTSIAKIWGAMVSFLGPFGIPAAIAAGAGLVGLASSFFSKGDDVLSPGGSGGGYGKRTLFGPEGAIQLNDKDTVIAGTNLFDKADDMVSSPKGTVTVSNKTAPAKETPVDPSAGTNARLDALIAMTGKVNTVSTIKVQ